MRHALVALHWVPADAGGRHEPVGHRRYMAPAAVGDGPPAWTLVVDRSASHARDHENALVHFLMDEAPHETLVAGQTLQLFEGARVIAKAQVEAVFDLNPATWSDGLAA